MPLMKLERSISGSLVASMSGNRLNSSRNITVISRRARWAPRQKWGPGPPKPTWGFGIAPYVEAIRGTNAASSRLAEL